MQPQSKAMPAANQETDLARALRPWTDRAAGLVAAHSTTRGSMRRSVTCRRGNRLRELYHSVAQTVSDAAGTSTALLSAHHEIDPTIHQTGLGPTQTANRRRATRRF